MIKRFKHFLYGHEYRWITVSYLPGNGILNDYTESAFRCCFGFTVIFFHCKCGKIKTHCVLGRHPARTEVDDPEEQELRKMAGL